ncbi:GTP-binding protein ryH1, putative [Entamoeba invadens IP1]|uniref:GTP-binding protein ryH1, putative n=1 Tax=Entamoeba invadens IP1 TaxID=370355 RepID=A0A0A1U2N5_ENTIV|nr:GTP-binding protein ryH1, putative [Entamoeba invadens IP1]ELP88336.1 GTP-binding protein ryH1, putative [Entamoeba invadens IP1]|eukprot:XP_004255107.1 GTP-binding protein ryH1, putative [Entamoeba invadens IP1]
MNPTRKYKVVFIGDSSVGKTCIIGRFMSGMFVNEYEATVGTDFSSKLVTDDKTKQTVQLQIWDTAGQEKYHSLIPSYIRESRVAVVVYDISDRDSFNDLDEWISLVKSEEKKDVFLFLVGNKNDIGKREVTQKEALDKADYYQCQSFETSAKENCNITELFKAITERLCSIEPISEDSVETVSITESNSVNTKFKCC